MGQSKVPFSVDKFFFIFSILLNYLGFMNNFIIYVSTKSLGSHADDVSYYLEDCYMNYKGITHVIFMNGGPDNVRYRWIHREKQS